MCCECCSVTQRKIWVFGWGTILVALGITLVVVWPDMAEKIVDKNLVIIEGSSAYESWVHAPIPIYLDFYMFNWTNPEDFYNPNIKPRFVELGPYSYLETHYKENITHYDNHTVSYFERRIWKYDPERSNGTEMDMITMLHPPTATVADEMRHSNKIVKKVINFILNREGGHLHVTRPLHEWIFDGYQDDLIDFLKLFNTSKIHIPYDRFGFLAERNGTLEYDGEFTMLTGELDLKYLGHLTNWNGRPETGYYERPCGIVNGTTGDLFAPYLSADREITVFVTDACRYMNLVPDGTEVHHGVEGIKFVGTTETLDSGENFPDQQCFCNPKHEVCPKTGVVDCKKCRDNAPIYASFPHFYLADESYLNAVEGLKPNKDLHQFKLTVEPRTGIPVKINGRIQINMMIEPDDAYDIYRGVPHILMPLFWFQQIAEMDGEVASQTKLALNLGNYGFYAGIGMICMGGILYTVGIALTLTKKWKRTPQEDEDVLSN